ncbi:hypothetical protein L484_021631 [Morus notabilis]|uniref:Uncharacterized protein n=1 Tax=Morus notabilis TaxID=981085 RepID=W9S5Z3_9ROSA|nr:hypothetical protein L484_021631 [Morus notabilis]
MTRKNGTLGTASNGEDTTRSSSRKSVYGLGSAICLAYDMKAQSFVRPTYEQSIEITKFRAPKTTNRISTTDAKSRRNTVFKEDLDKFTIADDMFGPSRGFTRNMGSISGWFTDSKGGTLEIMRKHSTCYVATSLARSRGLNYTDFKEIGSTPPRRRNMTSAKDDGRNGLGTAVKRSFNAQ